MLMMACDKAYVLGTCLPPSNRVFLLPQVHVLELVKHPQLLSRQTLSSALVWVQCPTAGSS